MILTDTRWLQKWIGAFIFMLMINPSYAKDTKIFSNHATKKSAFSPPFSALKKAIYEPEMVLIPAGSFKMGSTDNDKERDGDEGPQRIVTIRTFMIGKYDVTRGEFAEFVAETGYDPQGCFTSEENDMRPRKNRNWANPGFPQNDSHPVVCVNWLDANVYAKWLKQKTGKNYRLPSEAEWEYAARAGTTTSRYWGDSIGINHAQCDACNNSEENKKTLPVGRFAPNAFGLYDMLGLVWQWVEDCGRENYKSAPIDGTALLEANCTTRAMRGGSWSDNAWLVRSSSRSRSIALARFNYLGFRLAQTLP